MSTLRPRRIPGWGRARRALRASHWWYFTALPLVVLVSDTHAGEHLILRILCSMVVAALCLAYAYGLNGITDRGMDHNEAKNPLAGLSGVPPEAAVLVGACAVGAVGLAAALTPVALLGAGVSLIAATLYSASLRLKRLPVVGTLVNLLIFAPLPLLAAARRPSSEMLLLTYCFWVLLAQNQILHEVSDAPEDAPVGVRTTGVVVGPFGLRIIALLLGPLSVLPLWWVQTETAVLFSAVLGLCAGAAMVASCNQQRARRLRFVHRWLSLVVGVVLFALVARSGA